MYSKGKKEKKESALVKYARHIGISAVVVGALVGIIIVVILWWMYGYNYVIVPMGETAFEALNSTV
jgi:hypothetical protein